MQAFDFVVNSATVSHPNEQTVVELCSKSRPYQHVMTYSESHATLRLDLFMISLIRYLKVH